MTKEPVPRGRIRRTMPLAGFTARAAGGRLVAGLREKAGDEGAVERFHERTAERYTELLGHSKGVLMKAGQMFSLVDLESESSKELSPYGRALTRLQADAPPMTPELARQVFADELGGAPERFFAEFSDAPVAAASIGQVHHARLHDGRQVAVKIQYPGVAQAIQQDLANTELMLTAVRFLASAAGQAMQMDPRVVAQEIAARVGEEVDYRHEAASIAAFGELFRGHPFIKVPDVIAEMSADRVLTMTYLDGLDWSAAQRAEQSLKNTWAETIWRFVCGGFRHSNLFHADPHPGNYRFGLDGSVGFIDFGCVKTLPEEQRFRVVAMDRAVVENRREDLRRLMAEAGFFEDDPTVTADEAYRWMSGQFGDVLGPQPATFTTETTRRSTEDMFDLSAKDSLMRRVSVPADFVFLSRFTLGLHAVTAMLGATFHTRAMLDDLDGAGEPISPLGLQHVAWVRERGLPFGLENRKQTGVHL